MIAQELKIGDWVLVDGEPTILTELQHILWALRIDDNMTIE